MCVLSIVLCVCIVLTGCSGGKSKSDGSNYFNTEFNVPKDLLTKEDYKALEDIGFETQAVYMFSRTFIPDSTMKCRED